MLSTRQRERSVRFVWIFLRISTKEADVAEPWDELEYRELFEAFPLSGREPAGEALDRLTRRLNHSSGGIRAQWQDARSYCNGANRTAASEGLQSYLDRMGLCRI